MKNNFLTMSLNTKKYWLDGIFDDKELYSVISEESKKESDIVIENEIVIQLGICKEILCKDYVYCDDIKCRKRHYYRRLLDTRIWNRKFAFNIEDENKSILYKSIIRFKREGWTINGYKNIR